jgi:hypothetical protein
MNPKQNTANQQNANKGVPGTNLQYDQVHGNRGKQLAGKQSGKTGGKSGGKGGRR